MDVLRARAFMDILLGMDSRPLGTKPDGSQAQTPAPAPGSAPGPGGPLAGMIPPGFAGHVTLTIPAATLIARGPGGRARRDRAYRPQSWSKYIGSLPSRSIGRPQYPAHQRTGPSSSPLSVTVVGTLRQGPVHAERRITCGSESASLLPGHRIRVSSLSPADELAGLIAECSGTCMYD